MEELEISNLKVVIGSALIWVWKVDVILPCLNLLDLKDKDSQNWEQGLSLSLEILTAVLTHSLHIEKYFLKAQVFHTIAGILSRFAAPVIGYSLYIGFFSLSRVFSLEDLREDLFKTILVNPKFWRTATPDDHIQIVSHWRSVLFPIYPILHKARGFDYIVNTICSFYPYQPSQVLLPEGEISFSYEKVPEIRKHFAEILLYLARVSFTLANYHNLFYQCISYSELHHVEFSTSLIKSIIVTLPEQFKASGVNVLELLGSRYFLPMGSTQVIMNVVEIVIEAHKLSGFQRVTLSRYLNLLLGHLQPSWIDDFAFQRFSDLLMCDVPEVFPFCTWYAINNPHAERIFIDCLLSLEDTNSRNTDVLWLVMAAVRTTNSQLRSALLNQFCRFIDYVDAVYRLQVTCFVFGEDEAICFEYLDKLVSTKKISKDLFVKLTLSLVFWRPAPPNQLLNPLLRNAFERSVFEIEPRVATVAFPKDQPIVPDKVFRAFCLRGVNIRFELRTGSGTWSDLERGVCVSKHHDHSLLQFLVDKFTKVENEFTVHTTPLPRQDLINVILSLRDFFGKFNSRVAANVQREHLLMDAVIKQARVFPVEINEQAIHNLNKWSVLWSFLSNRNGPWDSSENHDQYWKRDDTLCFVYCPFKLRRNRHFDDHQVASRTRDTGQQGLERLGRPGPAGRGSGGAVRWFVPIIRNRGTDRDGRLPRGPLHLRQGRVAAQPEPGGRDASDRVPRSDSARRPDRHRIRGYRPLAF
jgi:hypothetical protein